MRLCDRNCKTIWFSTNCTEQSITDSDGMDTGETKIVYSGIKSVKANVRWYGDMVEREPYGAIEKYTCKIMVEVPHEITEESVIWLSNPVHTDGTIDPPEQIVKRISDASSHSIIRTSKVTKDA